MIGRISAHNFQNVDRRVTSSDTAPGNAAEGDIWYKTDVGALLIYYDNAWIEVAGGGTSGGSSTYTVVNDTTDSAIILMEIGP